MTKTKICGLRDFTALQAATAGGADFVGFVFIPRVRRQVSVDHARTIIIRLRQERYGHQPELVGLFYNQSADEVNSTAQFCGLDLVQLCGEETLEYCSNISIPVIKVIHIRPDVPPSKEIDRVLPEVLGFTARGIKVTLDHRSDNSPGGTGVAFDWTIAREIGLYVPIILAGGLNAGNINEAIQACNPWGVDVSSGVEVEGIKQANKILEFLAAAHPI